MVGLFRSAVLLVILLFARDSVWAEDSVVKPANPSDVKTEDPAVAAKVPEMKTVQELAAIAKKSVVVVTFTGRDGPDVRPSGLRGPDRFYAGPCKRACFQSV